MIYRCITSTLDSKKSTNILLLAGTLVRRLCCLYIASKLSTQPLLTLIDGEQRCMRADDDRAGMRFMLRLVGKQIASSQRVSRCCGESRIANS